MFSFHSYFPSFLERANSHMHEPAHTGGLITWGWGGGGATLISAKGCHAS